MSWWSRFTRWMRGDGPAAARPVAQARAVWRDAAANRFGIPILDFTPAFDGLLSASGSVACADRAMSWGRSTGEELDPSPLDGLPPIECDLRYPVASPFPDGLLFTPAAMEEKWVLAHRRGELLAARSWTGTVEAVARLRRAGDELVVHELRVVEGSGLLMFGEVVQVLDWLVRTHALGELHPLPLGDEAARGLEVAPLAAFGTFGSKLVCGARSWAPGPCTRPLRSDGAVLRAVRGGDVPRVRSLVAAGEAVDAPSTLAGYTPLAVAVAQRDVAMVATLLSLGADPRARDARGNFTLGIGIVHDAPQDLLDELVARGADVRAVNDDGFGALHAAAEVGHARFVPWLLGLGLELEARTGRGHTALHIASALGRLEAVKALVEAGADVQAGSTEGTALEIARAEGKREVVTFLDGLGRA